MKNDTNKLIEKWSTSGLITQEQRVQMLADLEEYVSDRSGETFISILMYMGTSALSLGALLLIATNWSGFSKSMQLILALLLPIVPLSFAYWQMTLKGNMRVLPRAMSLFGMVLIGGSVALIEQIYNLQSDITTILWFWTILLVPFIFVFRTVETVFFGSIMLGITVFVNFTKYLGEHGYDGSVAVILLTLYTLLYAYFMYAIGNATRYSEIWKSNSRTLRINGAFLAIIVLFVTTFEEHARTITNSSYYASSGWQGVSVLCNALFVGFLVFVLLRAVKYEEYALGFSIVRIFGLYLLVKYCTLFFSMFETGLFFMLGGALFIAGGWVLERNKQQLIGYMKRSRSTVATSYEQQ